MRPTDRPNPAPVRESAGADAHYRDLAESLEKRLRLETLLADLSRRFLVTEAIDLDAAIREGLAELASVGRAERAFVLCLSQSDPEATSYFEWCAPGVPERGPPKGDDWRQFESFFRRLQQGESICAPVARELPDEFARERDAIVGAGIQSYLLMPSTTGDRLVGILGLHAFRHETSWPESELAVLRLITDLFATAVRQKRYETALAESEERFRALAENSRDSICEISATGEILYVSPSYAGLAGIEPSALLGHDALEQVHEDDRESVREAIADVLAGDDQGAVTYRTRHADGSWLYIEASARGFSSAHGEERLVAVLRDVTLRERSRQMLSRQLEAEKRVAEVARFFIDVEPTAIGDAIGAKLATVAEIAGADHGWIATLDPTERIPQRVYDHWRDGVEPREPAVRVAHLEDYSERFPEVLDGGEVLVRDVAAMPDEAKGEREALLGRGARAFLGIPLTYERRLIGFMGFESTTGERTWSRETVTLLRLIAEIFVSALRREHAHLELERSRSQLVQSQKMEAVGTLAGGIAHDFNNHLSVMLGNAAFVMSAVGERPELREALSDLKRSAEHCAQLTRSLLAFSRRNPARVESIAVVEVLKAVAELVRPLLPSSIHLEIGDDGLESSVRADETQLRQVFVNLLVNARDAMPSGGRLTLHSRRRAIDELEAGQLGLRTGAHVEVVIRDTGVGMEPAILQRIFEPFFTTKPLGQGTGLGLATAYGIVRQSQGVITVDSEPGMGTEFRVLLPRAVGAPEPEHAKGAGTSPESDSLLLVEDEPAVRRLLARILRGAGYRVVEAADGMEALDAARRHGSPSVLVTDLVMPRMGGAELASRLRTEHPELAVLFLSGHADPDDTVPWGEMQSAHFLQKPFDEEALLSELRRLRER